MWSPPTKTALPRRSSPAKPVPCTRPWSASKRPTCAACRSPYPTPSTPGWWPRRARPCARCSSGRASARPDGPSTATSRPTSIPRAKRRCSISSRVRWPLRWSGSGSSNACTNAACAPSWRSVPSGRWPASPATSSPVGPTGPPTRTILKRAVPEASSRPWPCSAPTVRPWAPPGWRISLQPRPSHRWTQPRRPTHPAPRWSPARRPLHRRRSPCGSPA